MRLCIRLLRYETSYIEEKLLVQISMRLKCEDDIAIVIDHMKSILIDRN